MRTLIALAAALLLSACAHPLEVRNLDRYSSLARGDALERQATIGLITAAPDKDTLRLANGIGPALAKYSARVVQPMKQGAGVEVIARINVSTRYEGSGGNWFVNFPGLLFGAPSWNGYGYTVGYEFQILLTRAWDNAKLDSWTMPVSLDVRHSSGMLLSPDYNPEVTEPTVDRAGEVLADHVAREIVRRLNSDGRLWKLAAPDEAVPVAAPAPEPSIRTSPIAPAEPIAPPPVAPPATPAPPTATPAPATPATTWASGQTARLRPGAAARIRSAPDAEPAKGLDLSQPVLLKARISRPTGPWWYVTGSGGFGWVLESDLTPP